WPIAQAIIKWMRESPVGSQRALQTLWLGRTPANLREFDTSLPRERFPHPIVRRAVVLMLQLIQSDRLIAEVRASAHVKPSTLANKPAQTTVSAREPSSDVDPSKATASIKGVPQGPTAVTTAEHASPAASQQPPARPFPTRRPTDRTSFASNMQQPRDNTS